MSLQTEEVAITGESAVRDEAAPLRILITADPELPVPPKLYGGIERIIDSLVRGLEARGHEVALVSHPESECPASRKFAWPGRASQNTLDCARNTAALWRAIRAFQPDVIHSFSRIVYLLPILKSRLPKIMSYQRSPGTKNISRAVRLAHPGTMYFTGCSEHICGLGRLGGGDWTAIHNFVDVSCYTPTDSVPNDAPLVFLSRIERIKGAHTAIAAALKAKRRLLIAGNYYTEGEAGEYWRREIEPHIGRDGIEYVGPVNDAQKNDLLRQAAAMIVPIEWDEPFGIVFAEALACGAPVIATPRGAVPEIVEHGRHGFHVNGVDEAVSAIARLGEIDRRECRLRAEECFNVDVILGRYESLYRRTIAAGAKR